MSRAERERRLARLALAASVLDADDLAERLTEAERLALAVALIETMALLDAPGPAPSEVLPFRRRPL